MRGFMHDTILNQSEFAVEFLSRALEVLRWGLQTWRDVPQEDKGAIFAPSFIQGVHSLYLQVFMKVKRTCHSFDGVLTEFYAQACRADPRKFKPETLFKEAQKLLRSEPPLNALSGLLDRGFSLSFTIYPCGRALS